MMKPKEIPVYIGIRLFLFLYGMLMWVSGIFGPRKKTAPRGMRVLLTGQFYSSNWILAHLKPLCMSSCCKEIIVVANCEIPAKDKVRILRPPVWLNSLAGATLSRLIYFAFIAAKTRPDVVGGFHLLLNGLSAALIARVVGARSLYFCVGGPAEVLDGGILSENRLFEKLREPHASIEKILTKWVTAFDIVITMGSSAVRFFKDRDMRGDVQIISGGLDTTYFTPAFQPATFDLIFAGRLVPIKRVDLFLESVRLLKESHPDIAAVIVGDGPLALELQNLSAEMGLSGKRALRGLPGRHGSLVQSGENFHSDLHLRGPFPGHDGGHGVRAPGGRSRNRRPGRSCGRRREWVFNRGIRPEGHCNPNFESARRAGKVEAVFAIREAGRRATLDCECRREMEPDFRSCRGFTGQPHEIG